MNTHLEEVERIERELYGPDGALPSSRRTRDDVDVRRLALSFETVHKFVTAEGRADNGRKKKLKALTELQAAEKKARAACERVQALKAYFDPETVVQNAWYEPRPAPVKMTTISRVLRQQVAQEEGRPMEMEDQPQIFAEIRNEHVRARKCAELAVASDDQLEQRVKSIEHRSERTGPQPEADAAELRDVRAELAKPHRTSAKAGELRVTVRNLIAALKLPEDMAKGARLIARIEKAPAFIEAIVRDVKDAGPDDERRAAAREAARAKEFVELDGGTPAAWHEKNAADAAARRERAAEEAEHIIHATVSADLHQDAAEGGDEATIH